MPFMTRLEPCKCCGESNKSTRSKWSKQNQKFYLQTTCKECEYKQNLIWRKENKTKWAYLSQRYYIKKNGPIIRNMNHTPETKLQWQRDKSNRRCTRAKQAKVSWDLELTNFIYKEAHELRKMRNKLTKIEWHVDHVIPLKNSLVCGLHVWNNFAVIPKVENLRKGNYYSIHD